MMGNLTDTTVRRKPCWANMTVIMALMAFANGAAADEDLGAQATNPVAPLVSYRLQVQVSNYNNADGESVTGLLQTVYPFQTGWDSIPAFLTRITIPYVRTQEIGSLGHIDGFGDTSILSFFIPKRKFFGGTFAFGPLLSIPTGGDNEFVGSGQWQIGPNFVYINTSSPSLQWGALLFANFSFADTRADTRPKAASISTLSIQPIITKHLDNGWYIGAPDLPQTYNLKTEQWVLNLGPVVGRVFKLGKQAVQIYGGVYYNTEDYGDITPEWTFKFNFSFLIPK